ncbi:MAG: HlyD family efflux transporter periplasmic adaptor subunit [Planctomycetota bacterium]
MSRTLFLHPLSLTLLTGSILLTSGCPAAKGGGGHDHGAGGDHADHDDHGDSPKTEAITEFSARHEAFIEHPFLVRGVPARFVTHVTDTEALAPRTEGPVTYVLQLGDAEPLRVEALKPARAGIYLPELVFTQAGTWHLSLEVPGPDGTDVVQLPDRTVYATQEEADAVPETPLPEDGVAFLKEQQWKLEFHTLPVERRTLVERLQLPGRVLAPPAGRAVVAPPVAGRLLPPEGGALPEIGQRVEAGQVLAQIQPPLAGSDHLTVLSSRQQLTALRLELRTKAAEARTEATVAEVALARAAQQLTRVRGLAERQAKSPREVEQAVYEHARAEAELQAAQTRQRLYADVEAQLQALPADLSQGLPVLELVAPIAGVIVQATGALGELLPAQEPVFTLLDRSRLQLEVKVPESALGRVPAEPGVVFSTPGDRTAYRDAGRLLLPAIEVDPEQRAARLVYALPSSEGLAAGLAVEAFVATTTSQDALAIPESALVEEDGRYVAFVLLGGEAFAKRELTLGVRDGGWVEVRSGVAEGERVVDRGAYAVKLASVATTIPAHGHSH